MGEYLERSLQYVQKDSESTTLISTFHVNIKRSRGATRLHSITLEYFSWSFPRSSLRLTLLAKTRKLWASSSSQNDKWSTSSRSDCAVKRVSISVRTTTDTRVKTLRAIYRPMFAKIFIYCLHTSNDTEIMTFSILFDWLKNTVCFFSPFRDWQYPNFHKIEAHSTS